MPKSEMPHRFNLRSISLHFIEYNRLNRNPEIYEKAGTFRHISYLDFGATIAAHTIRSVEPFEILHFVLLVVSA
jgi:hypothetical protein